MGQGVLQELIYIEGDWLIRLELVFIKKKDKLDLVMLTSLKRRVNHVR